MKQQCEYLVALARGEYIKVADCPCDSCQFTVRVWELEQTMTESTGELPDGWMYLQ